MLKGSPIRVVALLLGSLCLPVSLTAVQGAENERAKEVAQRVGPKLRKELAESGLEFGSEVFLRVLKEERELELWIKKGPRFALFRSYRIAGMSGQLGPKLAEGDRQAPEGFYYVPPGMMKPDSRYHLAFNIGYPNRYDREHERTGSFIMVHGNRFSIGCFAMTDGKIEEIYTLCDAALQGGQRFFRIHCFPFRMSAERMAQAEGEQWEDFWKELKPGYDWFEEKKVPPNVTVQERRYLFSD